MKYCEPQSLNPSDADTVLLDVRTPAEYAGSHIEGSVLRPLHTLDAASTAREIGGQRCVVICQSGKRAEQAASALTAAGVQNIEVLRGGMNSWQQAGRAVNRGKGVISIERQVRIGAGSMVVLGIILALTVNPAFLALSAFVGCGLIFAGITDWCGMGLLLARMPWNNTSSCSCSRS
jgi:rhodanese-related sulfurtransferase